jgi:hypothetical protein
MTDVLAEVRQFTESFFTCSTIEFTMDDKEATLAQSGSDNGVLLQSHLKKAIFPESAVARVSSRNDYLTGKLFFERLVTIKVADDGRAKNLYGRCC